MSGPRISSFCECSGCVAVERTEDGYFRVSDSCDPTSSLVFTAEEWRVFVLGVKNGEFDVPEGGQ